MSHLEERMEILEHRVNRYRSLTLLLGLCLTALVLMGATDDEVQEFGNIRAKKIELMGDEGNVAMLLRSYKGDGLLIVSSKEGQELIYAGADVDGDGLLIVSSKEGQELIYAGAEGDGDGLLAVSSRKGKRLIGAGADVVGNGRLIVSSKEGQELIYAGASESEDGNLSVYSKKGQKLIHAGVGVAGNGLLTVHSQEGQKLIYAGADRAGNGAAVELFNKTGETVVRLYADDNGNGVVGAFNRKGKSKTLKPR